MADNTKGVAYHISANVNIQQFSQHINHYLVEGVKDANLD
jgi:hypothetical protein